MKDIDAKAALENNLRLIEHQLEKIHEEIEARMQLSQKILAKLNQRLEVYIAARNDPNALLNHSAGEGYLKDREHVNQLIRETRHQICAEERSYWNDLQKLHWEMRNLEREKAQLEFNLRFISDISD